MIIEPVNIKDAEELLLIYAPYVKNTAISFEYEAPSLMEFQDRIKNISADLPYIKVVDKGEILGYAYASKFKNRRAYDWSVEVTIYVKNDHKRLGIGRMLYDALEASLKEIGILNMNACIAVAKEDDKHLNNDSYYFHKKMGFNLVGTFHNSGYKFNTWYDMIWMEKIIGEHQKNQEDIKFGKWKIV